MPPNKIPWAWAVDADQEYLRCPCIEFGVLIVAVTIWERDFSESPTFTVDPNSVGEMLLLVGV
jgi:hypothetical protein